MDWTGLPSVWQPWRRLPVERTGRNKCRGGTSPVRRVGRRRVLSAINAESARSRGLTSGSARRLMSRATSHVAASGLCLSGERMRRVRPGHVSVLDPCSYQGFPCKGPRSSPDLTQRDLDPIQGARHANLGVPSCNRGSELCVQGSGAPLRRSGSTDTSWMYHLSSPHGAP
jgi:hypothetical protein